MKTINQIYEEKEKIYKKIFLLPIVKLKFKEILNSLEKKIDQQINDGYNSVLITIEFPHLECQKIKPYIYYTAVEKYLTNHIISYGYSCQNISGMQEVIDGKIKFDLRIGW